jgi:hypothetical protein
MADKYPYSLVRGIANTLQHGGPFLGAEGEFHAQAIRDINRDPKSKNLRLDDSKTPSFFAPFGLFTRDLSTATGFGGEFVAQLARGRSDLLSWSAVARAGALFIDGLTGNLVPWQISTLPVPEWLPEVGMMVPTGPVFSGTLAQPKRISGLINVSRQLLVQAGPNPKLDALIISDLSRQLGAYLDQAALLGLGAASHQPTGVKNWAGVPHIASAVPSWDLFAETEATIEQLNINLDNYGVICSPSVRQELRTTPAATAYPRYLWEMINGYSTSQLSGADAATVFFGAWQMLSILIWGSGVEILINPFTDVELNQVQITATILCDVSVRLPGAFSWITLE